MPRSQLPRVVADIPFMPVIHEMLAGRAELLPWQVALDGSADPVDGLYLFDNLPVDGALMDRLPGLKVISNFGVGVDHINLADARSRGIPVGHTPEVLSGATADMGFALLLAAARRLAEGERCIRSVDFDGQILGRMLGREVHGATLGIVGLGRIGRQVARRAAGFDMTVLYHDVERQAGQEQELGVRYVTFDELLAASDFVMLNVPLTDRTQGMIDAAALKKMKRSATLINISRGPVVDTAAITEALRTGEIASAGLDVTDPEPLPRDHPLLTLENVTITPHLGSATIETRQKMAETSVENLLAGLRGKALVYQA